MEHATTARISRVRVSKDKKTGKKQAAIELAQPVSDGAKLDGPLALAVEQMRDNPKLELVRLSITVEKRNLAFFTPGSVGKPLETVKSVELAKFRVKRDGDLLEIFYQFELTLEQAKRWLIPAIGDEVMVMVEAAQMTMGHADDAN